MQENSILEVRNASKHFPASRGIIPAKREWIRALDGVSLSLPRGKTIGIVGESGSGKTTLVRCMMGLLRLTEGEINLKLDGRVLALSSTGRKTLKTYRKAVQLVLQNPYGAFNPNQPVEEILDEPIRVHFNMSRENRAEKIRTLLESVSLDRQMLKRYPHQLSGGQLQRLSIARCLSLNPRVLILDEPVTALDAPIRIQVLNLLKQLQKELGLTYLLISHDLLVMRYMCDEIHVMYCGELVERIPAAKLFQSRHPYTHSLISALPVSHPCERGQSRAVPEGEPPDNAAPPPGCRFHPRCPHVERRCRQTRPLLQDTNDSSGHQSACHFSKKLGYPEWYERFNEA